MTLCLLIFVMNLTKESIVSSQKPQLLIFVMNLILTKESIVISQKSQGTYCNLPYNLIYVIFRF